MTPMPTPSIVISNGFSKFHLAVAAAEAARRGSLDRLLTGAYPTGPVLRSLRALGLDRHRKLARLVARGEAIPSSRVEPFWLAEGIHVASQIVSRLTPWADLADWMDVAAYRCYGHQAGRAL